MKRFSETEKWKDERFAELKPIEKLVFLFMVDSCDNAGFFEVNGRVNAFLIGIPEPEYLGAIKGLEWGLIRSQDLKKVWLRKFLFHQKNLPLNLKNNAHKQIVGIIKNNINDFEFDFNELAPNQGLFSPIGKGNSKGNSKGKEEGVGETKATKLPQQFRTRIGMDILSDLSPSEYLQKFHAMYYVETIMGKPLNKEALHADFDTYAFRPFNTEAHFLSAFMLTVKKQIQIYGTTKNNTPGNERTEYTHSGGRQQF